MTQCFFFTFPRVTTVSHEERKRLNIGSLLGLTGFEFQTSPSPSISILSTEDVLNILNDSKYRFTIVATV